MTENLVPEENLNVKKSQFFLFFLLLAILLAALTGLVFFTNKNVKQTVYTTQTAPTPMVTVRPVNAQTQLVFTPSTQTGLIGADLKTPISISTATNKLSGVQFSLNFDPKIVQVVDMVPGNFFANPTVLLKKIDNQKGRIDYAIGSLTPQNGENILATLSLKLISATSTLGTNVSFSDIKVADINEGSNNVLKSATGLTIVSIIK